MFRAGLLVTMLATLLLPRSGEAQTYAVTSRELVLPTNDLVYDGVTDRIYASVSSRTEHPLGNRIVAIDPVRGAVVASVLVGFEPGPLALSEDGQVLWVGLQASRTIPPTIRRVEVATLTPGIEFALGVSRNGPLRAEDIEVQPGSRDVIAVSRRSVGFVSPNYEGVAIYEDGVQRRLTTPGHTGAHRLEFSESPALLYGVNNESTEFGFRRIAVSEDGAVEIGNAEGLIPEFFVDILFERGRIYATNGMVVNPQAPPLGPFRIGAFSASGPVRPAAERGIVFIVEKAVGQAGRLAVFDDDTFALIDSVALDLPSSHEAFGRMVRWSTWGLAVRLGLSRSASDRILLLDIVEGPAPDEDADGLSDAEDNCPAAANPGQEDGDADGLGDACDRFPDDPDDLGACVETLDDDQARLSELEGEAARLEAELADVLGRIDSDRDGIADAGDACPGSRNGRVDSEGCQPWQRARPPDAGRDGRGAS